MDCPEIPTNVVLGLSFSEDGNYVTAEIVSSKDVRTLAASKAEICFFLHLCCSSQKVLSSFESENHGCECVSRRV